MRANRCKWVSRDDQGRPSCEHGPATKAGSAWRCRKKSRESNRRYSLNNPDAYKAAQQRYDQTPAGRERQRRYNATPQAKSSKQLYDLTRVRVS